jgi:hypothetical protein
LNRPRFVCISAHSCVRHSQHREALRRCYAPLRLVTRRVCVCFCRAESTWRQKIMCVCVASCRFPAGMFVLLVSANNVFH